MVTQPLPSSKDPVEAPSRAPASLDPAASLGPVAPRPTRQPILTGTPTHPRFSTITFESTEASCVSPYEPPYDWISTFPMEPSHVDHSGHTEVKMESSEVDLRRKATRRSAASEMDVRRRANRRSVRIPEDTPSTHLDDVESTPVASVDGEHGGAGSDSEETVSFDWNLHPTEGQEDDEEGDLDHAALAYRKAQGRRRCHWFHVTYHALPFALQCLIAALLGDMIIFVCLGLPDLMFSTEKYISQPKSPREWTSNLNIGGMPLLIWSGYLIISYSLHWLTRYILGVAPFLLQRSLVMAVGNYYEETLESWLSYLRAMHDHLTFAAWAVLSNILWNVLIGKELIPWKWQQEYEKSFNLDPNVKVKMWWEYVSMALMAILAVSLVWSGKKLAVCVIVSRYQRSAFSMRIKRMRFASDILRAFKRGQKKRSSALSPASKPGESVAVQIDGKDGHGVTSKPTLKDRGLAHLRSLFAKKAQKLATELGHTLLNPEILRAAKHIPASTHEATHLARSLFHKIAHAGQSDLRWMDFEPYFETKLDAKRAFRLFDKDGNGDVSKSEFRDILVGLVHEKQNLEDSIQDASSAVGSLEGLFSFISLFIILLCISHIFNLNINFSSLLALIVPLSFMFGSTAKDLFEAMIFLFVYQSYAVGDRIIVEKDFYIVKSVSIFTTVLQRGDGRIVHYPNSVLSKKAIDNVRQSGGMSEEFEVKVALETPHAKLVQLENYLKTWLSQQHRDFLVTNFAITTREIKLEEKGLVIVVNLQHRSNWQDMAARLRRRNAFLNALRDGILSVGLEGPEVAAA